MKRISLLFLTLLLQSISHAQITITQADFQPLINAFVVYGRDSSALASPGAAGANQTWDYSSLQPTVLDTSLIYRDAFPQNPLFPNANLRVSYAFPSMPSDSLYSYSMLNSSGFYQVGMAYEATAGSFTQSYSSVYQPAWRFIPLPITYGLQDSDTTTTISLISITPTTGTDSQKTITHRQSWFGCDGWGTLITPYNTYSALRTWGVTSETDTTYAQDATGNWIVDSYGATVGDTGYVWFTQGMGWVGGIDRMPSGKHRYRFIQTFQSPTSVKSITQNNTLTLYPNPARDKFYLHTKEQLMALRIISLDGKLALSISRPDEQIDVAMLPAGFYSVHAITVGGATLQASFVKE